MIARVSHARAAGWLALASLLFYGWWDYHYIPLLLGSIVFNYFMGWHIGHASMPRRRYLLAAAIVANLVLLGYYKYADFFIHSANALGAQLPVRGQRAS